MFTAKARRRISRNKGGQDMKKAYIKVKVAIIYFGAEEVLQVSKPLSDYELPSVNFDD